MKRLHRGFWYAGWAKRLTIVAVLSLLGTVGSFVLAYDSFVIPFGVATIVFGVAGWACLRRAKQILPEGPEEMAEEMAAENPDLFDNDARDSMAADVSDD